MTNDSKYLKELLNFYQEKTMMYHFNCAKLEKRLKEVEKKLKRAEKVIRFYADPNFSVKYDFIVEWWNEDKDRPMGTKARKYFEPKDK